MSYIWLIKFHFNCERGRGRAFTLLYISFEHLSSHDIIVSQLTLSSLYVSNFCCLLWVTCSCYFTLNSFLFLVLFSPFIFNYFFIVWIFTDWIQKQAIKSLNRQLKKWWKNLTRQSVKNHLFAYLLSKPTVDILYYSNYNKKYLVDFPFFSVWQIFVSQISIFIMNRFLHVWMVFKKAVHRWSIIRTNNSLKSCKRN